MRHWNILNDSQTFEMSQNFAISLDYQKAFENIPIKFKNCRPPDPRVESF